MNVRARGSRAEPKRARLRPGSVARWLLLASAGSGCLASRDVEPVQASVAPVIYGADDRSEVFAEPDARLRAAASNATAAIVLSSAISVDAAGSVTLDAPSAQEAFDLCRDEPFAQQSSAALCTAVLVAPDIALTAGHCLTWMSCSRLALVFGFEQAGPERARPLRASDVYACAEVLSIEVSQPQGLPVQDFAFMRLERVAEQPLQPVQLASDDAVLAGESLIAIGHGAGLPTKIARNGVVTDVRAASGDYFLAQIDNFAGGSGAGVFDRDARLVGVATSGELDFEPAPEGCMRARRVATDQVGDMAAEKIVRLAPMLDSLCAARAGATELCGSIPGSEAAQCSLRAPGVAGRARTPTLFATTLAACALLAAARGRRRRRGGRAATSAG